MKKKQSQLDQLKTHLCCGSCLYLEREKTFEKPCSLLGKVPTSKQCPKFTPNGFELLRNEDQIDAVKSLRLAISGFTNSSDLMILAGILLNEKKLRRNGFMFMQKVYVRLYGSANADFMDNFVAAYVIDADRQNLRLVSHTGKTCITVINDKNGTVYTGVDFEPIRAKMLEQRLYADPARQTVSPRPKSGFNDIPTLDNVPTEDFEQKNTRRKVKLAAKDDLVSFIERLNRASTRARVEEKKEKLKLKKEKALTKQADGSVLIKY